MASAKPITTQDIDRIIVTGDPRKLVTEAERFGKELADDKLSKSQIRSAFGTVRQIEAAWTREADANESLRLLREVLLLKPRLAYQAKRDRSGSVRPLADVLTVAIDKVAEPNDHLTRSDRFERFVDLFEAILAYHTAFEKKEGSHG